MNKEDIVDGMSVNVKGSSPVMTVVSSFDRHSVTWVKCTWKDVEGRDATSDFPVDALEASP